MKGIGNARFACGSWRRGPALAAVLVFLLPAVLIGQRNNTRQQSAPRPQAPRQNRPVQPRMQQPRIQQPSAPQRQLLPQQNRLIPQSIAPQQNRQLLPQQREFENRIAPARPAYNGMFPQTRSQQPSAPTGESVRPALPPAPTTSTGYPGAVPPGHLGSWLNQHGNLPVQGQEQLLRNDPSFKRLPQSDQQRLVQQLQQVNKLPEQERQRRLARAESIERMNPQQRMELSQSTRQLSNLPADRQNLVKRAFRDLRGVPLDQRQTVLNSERYQGQFSPEERGILGNLLRAEPYQPQ